MPKNKSKSNNKDRIRRPPNAFFIFRREITPKLKGPQIERSKEASRMWRNLDPVEKVGYHSLADIAAVQHKFQYPFYKFQPLKTKKQKSGEKAKEVNDSPDEELEALDSSVTPDPSVERESTSSFSPDFSSKHFSDAMSSNETSRLAYTAHMAGPSGRFMNPPMVPEASQNFFHPRFAAQGPEHNHLPPNQTDPFPFEEAIHQLWSESLTALVTGLGDPTIFEFDPFDNSALEEQQRNSNISVSMGDMQALGNGSSDPSSFQTPNHWNTVFSPTFTQPAGESLAQPQSNAGGFVVPNATFVTGSFDADTSPGSRSNYWAPAFEHVDTNAMVPSYQSTQATVEADPITFAKKAWGQPESETMATVDKHPVHGQSQTPLLDVQNYSKPTFETHECPQSYDDGHNGGSAFA